jgi:hypothetical protein
MSKPPILSVFSRKDYEKLSTSQVESRASGPSKWAKALLEKQGWKEGSGLGKEGSGLTSHVKVARRDGTTAIGYKAPPAGSAEVMGGGGGINSDQPVKLYDVAMGVDAFASNSGIKIGGAACDTGYSSDDSDDDEEERKRKRKLKKKRKRAEAAAAAAAEEEEEEEEGGSHTIGLDGGKAKDSHNYKKESSTSNASAGSEPPPQSDEFYKKLFKATGGSRLGMRARSEQKGKLSRAEQG